MHGLSPAQQGIRVLRALGCSRAIINAVVAEVVRWRPWGSLDHDDLWSVAVMTVWQASAAAPDVSPVYLRTRVRWRLGNLFNVERRNKGWRPRGNQWDPPYPPMQQPEWDWGLAGRPFRLVAA